MPSFLGPVRRTLLTPQLKEVTFSSRGFTVTPSPFTERLELVPQTVICGFEWGIDARNLWEVERRLEMVAPELRGFACEGVTMAFTILDAMGRGHRARDLLRGAGEPHLLLAYIGMGFAMARLPRRLWKKVVPDLSGNPYYPVMNWLAVDGYGFDRAYFDTKKFVDAQRVPPPYPWNGSRDYFPRAVDQGIGRALWFICGGRADDITSAVGRFASRRQADLWSGVGLAAAFAGGCEPAGLRTLRGAAGAFSPELALGVVFAVKARACSGVVPEHIEVAAAELADMTVEQAVALADSTAVGPSYTGTVPAYEAWRQKIRGHFAAQDVHGHLAAR